MEEFINLLQEFAFNLAVIALPVIAGFLIAALKALITKWLAEIEEAKPYLHGYLAQSAKMAVSAAEQMKIAGFIDDKKQYALGIVQAWLNDYGWDEVDVGMLEAAIEAAVIEQFPKE